MSTDLLFGGSVALLAVGCVLHVLRAMSEDLDALERLAQAPYDDEDDEEGLRNES